MTTVMLAGLVALATAKLLVWIDAKDLKGVPA